jgi:hypothetical protein
MGLPNAECCGAMLGSHTQRHTLTYTNLCTSERSQIVPKDVLKLVGLGHAIGSVWEV